MSRTFMVIFTTICWIGIAADALVHAMGGDFLVPAGMALAFVVWSALWRRHYGAAVRPALAEVRVPVEG